MERGIRPYFLPRRRRRALLRASPRLCAAFLRAFMRRPLRRRACLNFGRLFRDCLVRRAMARLYTAPRGCNQGPRSSYTRQAGMADPRELMQRYQDGDAAAFRELYALVSPRLLGYLVKMT